MGEDKPPAYEPPAQQVTYEQRVFVYANHDPNKPAPVSVVAFHLIAIVCAILSWCFTPLIEIIPAVLCFMMYIHIKENSASVSQALAICNIVITFLVGLFWLFIVLIIALFTFCIGLILIVFVLPYAIVILATLIALGKAK